MEAKLCLRLHHTKDGDELLSPQRAEALGVVHDKALESPGAHSSAAETQGRQELLGEARLWLRLRHTKDGE